MGRGFGVCLLALTACDSPAPPTADTVTPAGTASEAATAVVTAKPSFREQRTAFKTKTTKSRGSIGEPPPVPPPSAKLERVHYKAPLGENWAYITPDPRDGKKHPAVVYAAGGFDFSIGAEFFEQGPEEDDQSGWRLREGGTVMMHPSYRGTHDNPGTYEMFSGEVDDYLAAVDHVRRLS